MQTFSRTYIDPPVISSMIGQDKVTIRKGVYTVRKDYLSKDESMNESVLSKLITDRLLSHGLTPRILSNGNHWASFKLGGSKKLQSFYWVKFKIQPSVVKMQ